MLENLKILFRYNLYIHQPCSLFIYSSDVYENTVLGVLKERVANQFSIIRAPSEQNQGSKDFKSLLGGGLKKK